MAGALKSVDAEKGSTTWYHKKHCTICDANLCLREVTVPLRLMKKENGREDKRILMRSERQFLLNYANG